MPKKTRKRVVLLPSKVRNFIEDSDFPKGQKHKALKTFSLLLRNAVDRDLNFDDFVEIPCEYWKEAVCPQYQRFMNPIVEAGVLQRLDSYSNSLHFSKKYRVAPEFLDCEFERCEYEERKQSKNNTPVCKKTRQVLHALRLEYSNASAFITDYLMSGNFLGKVKFDEDVVEGKNLLIRYKKIEGGCSQFRMSKKKALELARSQHKSLIQDKRKLIIDYRYRFADHKSQHIEFSYLLHISNFQSRHFYAEITESNGRLNSNLTTMPSVLLQFFRMGGERMIGLDLSNSQFVFLAKLIEDGFFDKYILAVEKRQKNRKNIPEEERAAQDVCLSTTHKTEKGENERSNEERKEKRREGKGGKRGKGKEGKEEKGSIYVRQSEGFTPPNTVVTHSLSSNMLRFLRLAKSGKIYEFIRDELSLENGDGGRTEAKQMMFEIFFSSHLAWSRAKTRVRTLFPILIGMIDLFKKEKGDSEFALALQRKESEVFIGKILPALFGEGFLVLTKHDSVLCRKSEEKAVRKVMEEILDKELGQYNLKTEHFIEADD